MNVFLFQMPTSSQALILLSTDGQLPRYVSRRKFPVSSIPYPIRSLDINAVFSIKSVIREKFVFPL
jgi:hypothetical protein